MKSNRRTTMVDNIARWIGARLPRKILYYAVIKATAMATSGIHGATNVSEVTAMVVAKRLE